jgi:ElaB/YqjD/DUF883 family membrane-anchored ribosome-binding protein
MSSQATTRNERNGEHQSVVSRVGSAVYDAAESAATTAGETVEKGAEYLKENSPSDMMNDATELVRKNPITSVLVGLGIGFLLARVIRR